MIHERYTLLSIFVFWICSLAANPAAAIVDISLADNGSINFKARDATLDEIFKAIGENLKIDVKGLESQTGTNISYSYKAETTEDLLKSLLRHLGIKNYAFEFADAKLNRLVIVPGTASTSSTTTVRPPQVKGDPNDVVSVARIQSIVEGSQAESAGLQQDDYVLEYDGVQISSAQQLVREVEKKASTAQVELLVVRQKIPSRLILNGGFIGVRVTTQRIPRIELNSYLNAN